jgi:uncharacterized membrane protein YgcG
MDELWTKIIGLDLKSVRTRFATKKGWWWQLGHSPLKIEGEYRQFLFLFAGNPETRLVPWSVDLDEFWRQHMLDTRRYAADCNAIAGRLLERNPHLVKGSREYKTAFEATRQLYLKWFGESARKLRRAAGATDFGSDSTMVFSDHGGSVPHSHHRWHHASGHHAGHHHGHHGDAGQSAAHHGGGGHAGHSCGGHSGGGHSSCGGHSGCGGHGGH